jgi:hypothetical protein
MKAIKPSSLTRTITAPPKISSSRIMSPTMSSPSKSSHKRNFHTTPQEAANTRPTTTTHPGYRTQYFTSPPPHTPSQHPYDTRMYSSGSSTRRQQQHSGSPFDEDIIEELRPMMEQKARSKGSAKAAGDMRAMHTGKGEEWVW